MDNTVYEVHVIYDNTAVIDPIQFNSLIEAEEYIQSQIDSKENLKGTLFELTAIVPLLKREIIWVILYMKRETEV